MTRLLREGALVRPYPGVVMLAARAAEPLVRLRAAQAWRPGAVLIGRAARVVLDPTLSLDRIEMAAARPASHGTTIVHRLLVPDAFEHGGFRLPPAAWNAAWSAAADDGAAIDDHLRRGGRLADIRAAAEGLARTDGHGRRMRVLEDSRDEPWSPLERSFHALLRREGLTGWRTNVMVAGATRRWSCDVVFARARVIVEIDGWAHHQSRAAFERDRFKSADLTAAGWCVMRFTAWQLEEDPAWVLATLRDVLAARS